MAMNVTMTLLPIVLVMTAFFAIAWHDQPAGNPAMNSPKENQPPPKRMR